MLISISTNLIGFFSTAGSFVSAVEGADTSEETDVIEFLAGNDGTDGTGLELGGEITVGVTPGDTETEIPGAPAFATGLGGGFTRSFLTGGSAN